MRVRHQDRRCVATGEALAPEAPALRFGRDPEGTLTPDPGEKLPGRGAWISPSREALVLALRKGGFARSFKAEVRLPAGLDAVGFADRIAADLWRRALDSLGLARRAGQLTAGFEKVRSEAASLIACVYPVDAAPDGVRKMRQALAGAPSCAHFCVAADSFTLSQALGEVGLVHVGLRAQPAARRALAELRRAAAFAPASSGGEVCEKTAD
jgi:hypothetical protein